MARVDDGATRGVWRVQSGKGEAERKSVTPRTQLTPDKERSWAVVVVFVEVVVEDSVEREGGRRELVL
jgi:hypothetical protein